MQVTDVETFVVDADWRNWFFVQVTTDEGITGVGEALSGEGLTAALEATAEAHKHYVIGEDPLNRKPISRRLRRYPFAWRSGKLINAVAAAVDIALWDIAGKYYDEPVWKLLGGKVRDEIPVYANGWHIGERTPENYAHHAEKAVEEEGYPALKWIRSRTMNTRSLIANSMKSQNYSKQFVTPSAGRSALHLTVMGASRAAVRLT